MIGRLIRRLLGRTPTAPRMIGTNPGFLYERTTRRWVPEHKATRCEPDAYSAFGPIYPETGLPA